MVIPHPGPAGAAAALRVDAGLSILVGLVTGLGPLALGWAACHWIGRRMDLAPMAQQTEEIPAEAGTTNLPSLKASLLPIVLPLALIWLASLTTLMKGHCPPALLGAVEFVGHRCVALFIGAGAAIGVLMRQRGLSLGQIGARIGPPLETAGIIILITSAGGAFGASLESAGIGKAIAALAAGRHVNLIVLAYIVAMVLRIAQGSVTVAMIAAAGIMAPMAAGPLPYHPIYLFLAVGYGALFVSWMNDSGFWVISRLSGLSEKQTLASWTVLTAVLSVSGLLVTLALAAVLPLPIK
jgi:GntP family gluconate:H+ symporter